YHCSRNLSREVSLKQQVKDLIQKLGEAIHESVSDSDAITDVVREIRSQGFDVMLMLEATIGLNETPEEEATGEDVEDENAEDGPFTRNDLSFLKSLRIAVGELPTAEEPAEPEAAAPENIKMLPAPGESTPGSNETSA
ncbi:MAG: hypothetical protein ABI142_05425, partial [Bryocella sp.]